MAGVAASLELDRSTSTASVGFLHAGTAAQLAALKGAVEQEASASGVGAILRYGSTVGRALQAA